MTSALKDLHLEWGATLKNRETDEIIRKADPLNDEDFDRGMSDNEDDDGDDEGELDG